MSWHSLMTPVLVGVLAAALSVVLVELAIRLPFATTLAAIRRTAARAVHVVRSARASDHWKQKAMLAYSGAMLGASLRLAALLVVLAAVAAVAVLAADRAVGSFQAFMLSWQGILLTLVAACVYLPVRRALVRRTTPGAGEEEGRRHPAAAQGPAPR